MVEEPGDGAPGEPGEPGAPDAGSPFTPVPGIPSGHPADIPLDGHPGGDPLDAPAAEKTEREKVEEENQRKQDEYDQKIKDGQERADKLTEQFATWFYAISDADYEKLHRDLGDFIQDKEAEPPEDFGDPHDHSDPNHTHQPAEPASTLEDFHRLKEEGPEGGP